MRYINVIIFVFTALVVVGCSNGTQPTLTEQEAMDDGRVDTMPSQGYPNTSVPDDAYPAPVGSGEISATAYPVTVREVDESKRFEIGTPVLVGSTTVRGTGPANVAIQIISLSNVGEILGIGSITADQEFEITLSREIEPNETIAIQLADDSQRLDFLDAPGATDIPLIGFVLDTVSSAAAP